MSQSNVEARARRALVVALAGSLLACGLGGGSSAAAQSFPAKPATLVVPFPPGGPLDATGRAIAQKLTEGARA